MTVLFDRDIHDESSILQQPSSGIGLSTPKPEGPGTGTRILRAIEAFGSGLAGSPDPNIRREDAARKKKQTQLDELKGTVSALEHGVSMVQGMEGDERTKFVEAYAGRLDKIDAGLGETYRKLADRPDLLSKYKEYLPELPEHLQVMAKNDPKGFLRFVGTAEGVKAMGDGLDRRELRSATKKIQTVMMGYQQLVPPEVAKEIAKDGVITASEILSMQQYLPDSVKLSDSQMQAVQRNDRTFWNGLGVLHGEKEQEVLAARAKKDGKPPEVKEPKTEKIGGKVYQWDPEKTLQGTRLATDPRYVELGSAKEEGKGGLDKDTVQTELKISDDWRQDTKKFSERRPMFESVTSYMADRAKNKTSAGDAALAFAYAKMRDPNDRLAVSETRDLVKLGNIFERIGVNITGVLDKGETIPDRVAKQMYDEIRRNFGEQNRAQGKLEKQYRDKIKAYGGEPSRVMGEGLSIPEDQLKRGDGKKMSVGDVVSRGGKQWKVVGHDKDGEPLVEEVRGGR